MANLKSILGNGIHLPLGLEEVSAEDIQLRDVPALAEMLVRSPGVGSSFVESAIRGYIFQEGKKRDTVSVKSGHSTLYDFKYRDSGNPAFQMLYDKAVNGQWKGSDLAWDTDVDPLNPEKAIFPEKLLPMYGRDIYTKLDARKKMEVNHRTATWILSQFLHGEQGALFAAGQTVEATPWYTAKLYGATQVMDEGRHVEVFHQYIDSKLGGVTPINDNLFVVIHALASAGDWDLKFLGMQIMIEGLALGAFGFLYRYTKEPLLRELLKNVISDEARHVHYGVEALRDYYTKEVDEKTRREREDWAYEVAVMLRNRFLYTEIHEEYFGDVISREKWIDMVLTSDAMSEFRLTIFSRMIPNLREIGLLSDRIRPQYEKLGLMRYAGNKAANRLTLADLLADPDAGTERATA